MLARRIVANRRLLCAAPSYLARRGEPASPHDLPGHDCIVIRENLRAYNHWSLTHAHDSGRTTLVKVHGPLSTNHGEVAVEWAVAGHGILLRSEWDVSSLLREGLLQQVLPEWVDASADIHAVYPQRHHLSAKVRAFIDHLSTWFGQVS